MPDAHLASDRYDALIDRIGYGVFRAAADGTVLDANRTLAVMLGYPDPAAVSTLVIDRDLAVEGSDPMPNPLETPDGQFSDWVETRWRRADGSPLTVRLSIRAIEGSTSALEGYEGIVEDVTERRRQEELLRRSERLASLGRTLAGVAHELNNPLAAIMGFTQLLLRKSWPADDRSALETINHEAIRSATIVKDLLALVRHRDGGRRAPTDVNDVIGYIVRTRRYALETAGIACHLALDPALPPIVADRAQLEQVLLNLLNNAEQAIRAALEANGLHPPRAEVRVRTHHDAAASEVVIEVSDTGPGIPESIRSQIWDPFWTTKEEGEGTGLGLSVVHGIVVGHGGTISLDTATGGGARFEIRLPVTSPTHPQRVQAGHAARPLDVLAVDPGAADLPFVERFLTSRGHAVINASSVELALRLANQTSFDAVFCDARLVTSDGRSAAIALLGTPGCADARLVLSMAPDEALPDDLRDRAAVVTRPYDIEELRRLVEGE